MISSSQKFLCVLSAFMVMIILWGCSGGNGGNQINGKIVIHNNTTGVLGQAVLYFPTQDNDILLETNIEYPSTGADINQAWLFDHRLVDGVASTTCDADGSYLFEGLSEGYYILGAFADGYGWNYSHKFYLKGSKTLEDINLYPENVISDNIAQDQIWESGKHYIINGFVQVEQDVLLTIEPGVWIRFASSDAKIINLGAIKAVGNEDLWIRFTSDFDTEPIIWSRISLTNDEDDSSEFKYALVEYASNGISINNGRTKIDNCVVRYCSSGIAVLSTDLSEISRTTVYDCYISIECNSFMRLDDCFIFNCDYKGIIVSQFSGFIYDSIIEYCSTGLSEDYADDLEIIHCVFRDNEVGIDLLAGAENKMFIEYCDVVNSLNRGIYCHIDAYPEINYCNIYNNGFNIYCQGQASGAEYLQSGDISALNCYWGSSDIEEIKSTFYDGSTPGTNPNLGNVLFEPFSTEEIFDTGPR